MIDATHRLDLQSWVESANGHPEFPIQNLPLGLFSLVGGRPRGGMAIGDCVLDLSALLAAGVLDGAAEQAAAAAAGDTLNALLGLGSAHRRALRHAVSRFLSTPEAPPHVGSLLHPAPACTLHLPVAVGDYTDFYAGIHHATAVGKLFRPDAPLLPNYKHLPIAYHGRASSVRVSGADVLRPRGQIKSSGADPTYEPTRRLDFELELGIWIGAETRLGEPVPIASAREHVAGYCLLNDWSARDIQTWEYQPLGPFLAKNFLTTVSPWIITPEALEPFCRPQAARAADDPPTLPYLVDPDPTGAFDIALEVYLRTPTMRRSGTQAMRLTSSNTRHLYWTVAQMVAHHTSGGCNLRPGDLFGTGTISADDGGSGSLVELSRGGATPVQLTNGEERTFLLDGDEIILKARAERSGFASIGFGECRGTVGAALATPALS